MIGKVLSSMAEWLRHLGYEVEVATNLADARSILQRRRFQLLLLDIRLGNDDGLSFLPECRREWPEMAVILITGYGSVEAAVEAIRAGAADFLTKPIIDQELEFALERCTQSAEGHPGKRAFETAAGPAWYGLENIIGRDPRMQRVYDMIEAVADTRSTVLITGKVAQESR